MRGRRGLRRLGSEGGASAVEFAIIAGLLLMILFGIIQFGIAYNRTQGLNSAAREGARVAGVGAPESDIVTRVTGAQSLFLPNDVRITIDYSLDQGTTWTNVCDDPNSGTRDCTNNTENLCDAPGEPGALLRVSARVISSNKYAIAIPLWANWKPNWSGAGTYRCEKL